MKGEGREVNRGSKGREKTDEHCAEISTPVSPLKPSNTVDTHT